MTPEITIAIISGIVAVLVAFISKTELLSRKHHALLKDINLYDSLTEKSTKKEDLLKLIDNKIGDYIKSSRDHKRNGIEVILGMIFLATGCYLTWFFLVQGAWWLLGLGAAVLFVIFGVYGTIRGLLKVERDEKGNPVSKKITK